MSLNSSISTSERAEDFITKLLDPKQSEKSELEMVQKHFNISFMQERP